MTLPEHVEIIPYASFDGIMSFKDSQIMSVYDRIEAEGTAKLVFYDGMIANRRQFLEYMKKPEVLLYFVFYKNEPAAFFWLGNFDRKTAYIHYCGFKSGVKTPRVMLGKTAIQWTLHRKLSTGEYVFDMLYGIAPTFNRMGLKYFKKVGAMVSGMLPLACYNAETKKSEPGYFVYCCREDET